MRRLVIGIIVLFQSHWLDDAGTGQSDAAGIAVSAVGSLCLLAGLAGTRSSELGWVLTLVVTVTLLCAVVALAHLLKDAWSSKRRLV